MVVEVIPAGSSVVVTPETKDWAKDAERVKDVLAVMASTAALQFANVERSVANHFENTIQDIKDAESRLIKNSGDQFIRTIQDIKDASKDAASASAHTNELIQQSELNSSKETAHTREVVAKYFQEAERTAYQNAMAVALAFKDQALLSERLAAKQELLSEKLYAQAAREADECCCELKREIGSVKDALKQGEIDSLREQLTEARLLGRRFRTFSPVLPGTLQASDED